MTAEQLSTYIRLPYKNLRTNYKSQRFQTSQGKNKENYKGSQEKKLEKLCQTTCFLYQNKHYLDDDEENIWKKPTNCSQTPHKNQTEASSKKDIADIFHQQLQSTFPYFQKQCRETKTQLQVQ